jgi:tetratricopeptide (TPR) repeat protein
VGRQSSVVRLAFVSLIFLMAVVPSRAAYAQTNSAGGESAALFNSLGNAKLAKGQYDLAIQDFNQAIERNPNYAEAFNNRGDAYHLKGENDRAIRDFDQAIKLNPSLAAAFFHRGTVYSAQGAHERAIQDFDQAIKFNPNYSSALNNRCLSRATIGQLQEALSDCNAALWLRPDHGRATTLNVRGIVYLKLKQTAAALADFDTALKFAPKSASALYGRGMARRENGDIAGGNEDIRAAKAIQKDIADEFARHGIQ